MFTRPLGRRLALLLCLTLSACVYVPRTKIADDPECQGVQKSMVLEEQQVSVLQGCTNNTCLAMLAGAGIVTAASVVVSGSIAVVGNVVYWVERESKRSRKPSA